MLKLLHDRGISVRVATRHLAAEEAPESYKARLELLLLRLLQQALGVYRLAHPALAPTTFHHISCPGPQDVDAVVDTCHAAGISRKAVRLRPIAVIKG